MNKSRNAPQARFAAIQDLRIRLEDKPNDLNLQHELLSHRRALKLRSEVIESLEMIVKLEPHRVMERLQLGLYREIRGLPGSAAQQFDICIGLLNNNPPLTHNLIGAFLKTAQAGRDPKANVSRLQCLLNAINNYEPSSKKEINIRRLSQARMYLALRRRNAFLACMDDLDDFRINDSVRVQLASLAKRWQTDNPPGLETPKIFVIGLSRTGTTSLHNALEVCGFRSLHWLNLLTGRLPDDTDLGLYDAFGDINISAVFESLASKHLNARFILTQRPIEPWLRSIKDHYANNSGVNRPSELLNPRRADLFAGQYGDIHASLYAHHHTWADAFRAYEQRVETFFADQPKERLLKIDVTSGVGWKPLTRFLGVPEPDKAFPHSNASPRHNLDHGNTARHKRSIKLNDHCKTTSSLSSPSKHSAANAAFDHMYIMKNRIDFLIAGNQKCGTTTLHKLLRQHPALCMSKRKELHFFDQKLYEPSEDSFRNYHQRGWGSTKLEDNLLYGESTPKYVLVNANGRPRFLDRISDYNPNIKMIVLFRDPVARAHSHWFMLRKTNPDIPSFDIMINQILDGKKREQNFILSRGKYGSIASNLLSHFPVENCLFLMPTDLNDNIKEITAFIGASPYDFEPLSLNVNNNKGYILPSTVDRLRQFYYREIELFHKLTDADVTRWLG